MFKRQILALIGIGIGIVGLVFSIISFSSSRSAELAGKITSALNLLPRCGFSPTKFQGLQNLLLEAQKKLNIENNYDSANKLYDQALNDLIDCRPFPEIDPHLTLGMLAVILIGLMFVFGFLRSFR